MLSKHYLRIINLHSRMAVKGQRNECACVTFSISLSIFRSLRGKRKECGLGHTLSFNEHLCLSPFAFCYLSSSETSFLFLIPFFFFFYSTFCFAGISCHQCAQAAIGIVSSMLKAKVFVRCNRSCFSDRVEAPLCLIDTQTAVSVEL